MTTVVKLPISSSTATGRLGCGCSSDRTRAGGGGCWGRTTAFQLIRIKEPTARRNKPSSDHAPVVATFRRSLTSLTAVRG
jgi:hypothetical protein